jgi:hypothetical protein
MDLTMCNRPITLIIGLPPRSGGTLGDSEKSRQTADIAKAKRVAATLED